MAENPKTIQIQYHAILREKRGESTETIQTTAATVQELYSQLKKQHGFSLNPDRLRVAVNNELTDWATELKSGDHITFIPPVAGG